MAWMLAYALYNANSTPSTQTNLHNPISHYTLLNYLLPDLMPIVSVLVPLLPFKFLFHIPARVNILKMILLFSFLNSSRTSFNPVEKTKLGSVSYKAMHNPTPCTARVSYHSLYCTTHTFSFLNSVLSPTVAYLGYILLGYF